jgi:hypothetical protein
MKEQRAIVDCLEQARVLEGVRWAYASAIARTLDDYSEEAGYDAASLGSIRFTLFRDRLDRAFACGRYALQAGANPVDGLDLLQVELSNRDIATMPSIAPDLVRRADLNHSPGWAFDDVRFLLASCAFGKIDKLPWPQKSQTKQRVAQQRNPEPHPSLFDELAEEEVAGLLALGEEHLDLDTFVIGHTLDTVGPKAELVFGQPRINVGGGEAWHWYVNLLGTPPTRGGVRADPPSAPGPDNVPDVAVRLRRSAAVELPQANGSQ